MSSKIITRLALAGCIVLLGACSGEQSSAPKQQAATAPEPAASAPAASEAEPAMAEAAPEAPAEPVSPGEMIDHSADVVEFELKKALAGVESLIDDYTESGIDTAELEKKKEELLAQLKANN